MQIFRLFSLGFFLLISNFAQAFNNFDECSVFKELLLKNKANTGFDKFPWEVEEGFGVVFSASEEDQVPDNISMLYSQTIERLLDDHTVDEVFNLNGDNIYAINGKNIDDMDLDEYTEIVANKSLEIEGFASNKVFELTKNKSKILDVFFEPFVESIYDIDPKKGQFGSKVRFSTWWMDQRFLEPAKTVYELGRQKDPDYLERINKDPDIEPGFECSLSFSFINSLGTVFPEVLLNRFRTVVDGQDPTFTFSYQAERNGAGNMHDLALSADEKIVKLTEGAETFVIWKEEIFQGVFSNIYDLKNFPFDSQRLTFQVVPKDDWTLMEGTIRINLGVLADDALDTSIIQAMNNEWGFTDYNYMPQMSYFNWQKGFVPHYEFWFELSRNYEYYIYKLMLPIFLLLALTWSIFWIDPKNIETRVTISIVTFLALIAYNFVIDNDLAKLSYLTFLDGVILVSYLFAALPTFMAIYCNKLFLTGKQKWGKEINSISKVGFPAAYIISIVFVMIAFRF